MPVNLLIGIFTLDIPSGYKSSLDPSGANTPAFPTNSRKQSIVREDYNESDFKYSLTPGTRKEEVTL